MDHQKLEKDYNPKNVEAHWTKIWEDAKIHEANVENIKSGKKKPFTIILPPPNVTGYLHIGHALTSAIEDCVVRKKWMQNYEALYVPGMDHAGIATQVAVEQRIMKESKQTKFDLGRELFVDKVWEWKQHHGGQIMYQLKKLGSALDWSREFFTMSPQLSKAVQHTFITFYNNGQIYRDNRLVNWSCKLNSAISDIEVDYIEVKGFTKIKVPNYEEPVEFGAMVYFDYQLKDDPSQTITIATTRIETMLGDVAVAVNSTDERYKHMIGKELKHPFLDRTVQIITDDELVDKEFGTGAVKITPAHDPNDFASAKRHNLKCINILNDNGTMNHECGPYNGMKRFDVRKKIVEDLKALGLYKDKKPHNYNLAQCSRSKDIIEPLIRPQWYMKTEEVSKKMVEAVENGDLILDPKEFNNIWYYFLKNPKDWCISRQLWWGHRIPCWLIQIPKVKDQPTFDNQEDMVLAVTEEEALKAAKAKYPQYENQIKVIQDSDVLDTWFSSALLPFTVLGWPDLENDDFKCFFPNDILETGHDILFFWVSKMVMMGLLLTNQLPFKRVILHPIIRDKEGVKMSKSLGNVVDPLEIIEGETLEGLIKKLKEGNLPADKLNKAIIQKKKEFPNGFDPLGSDALRYGLLSYLQQSQQINLDIQRIVGYKQFCNKIWQAFKFAHSKIPANYIYIKNQFKSQEMNFMNRWILHRHSIMVKTCNESIDKYSFAPATISFQVFFRDQFCAEFLESIKPILSGTNIVDIEQTIYTIVKVLHESLLILHPMMPFLTEELFQKLPKYENKKTHILKELQPEFDESLYSQKLDEQYEILEKTSSTIRQLQAVVQITKKNCLKAYAVVENNQEASLFLQSNLDLVKTLGRALSFELINADKVPQGCMSQSLLGYIKLYLNVKEHIEPQKEVDRLEKKLVQVKQQLEGYEKKAQNKLPENIKTENEQKIFASQQEIEHLIESIENLKKMC